tara:strand:- start:179 stop:1057 length:879 start_codon:yes stop_codon:yes gene_type:complete
MRLGSLCAGYGGLEMGLSKIANVETTWVAEIDESANKLLDHRYGVPNFGNIQDLATEDQRLFKIDVPECDVITAGFPCQPFSQAGDRKGTEDERWLIDDVCRVASAAKAEWLILENVRGLLTANGGNALSRVCESMARSGFSRWEWGTLPASAVGAPHKRVRWFCVATNPNRGTGKKFDIRNGDWDREKGRFNREVGNNPERPCLSGTFEKYDNAVERWECIIGRRCPEPRIGNRINPWFVEFMMGLPEGWVCSEKLGLTKTACLAMLGNGVVPLQASYALQQLIERINNDR